MRKIPRWLHLALLLFVFSISHPALAVNLFLGRQGIHCGDELAFHTAPLQARCVVVVCLLGFATELPDGLKVGDIMVRDGAGQAWGQDLVVGANVAECEVRMQLEDRSGDPQARVILIVWLARDRGMWRVLHLGFDQTTRVMGEQQGSASPAP